MYQHMSWADKQIILAISKQTESMDKAQALLGHIVSAEYIWLSRIGRKDIGSFTPWTKLSIKECSELSEENYKGYMKIVEGMTDQLADSIIQYKTTKGDEMESRMGDILLHVGLHGSYHRGQIAAILKVNGFPPPSTDYILYCRQL